MMPFLRLLRSGHLGNIAVLPSHTFIFATRLPPSHTFTFTITTMRLLRPVPFLPGLCVDWLPLVDSRRLSVWDGLMCRGQVNHSGLIP